MNNTTFSYLRLLFYVLILLLLACFYWFGIPYIGCYWNNQYHIICPTCGVSRSTIALLHFNFSRAISHHLLFSCLLFPAFLILILDDIVMIIKRMITRKKGYSFIEILLGGNT